MLHRLVSRVVRDRAWIAVLALSLFVVVLRLPSLEQPFDNDSGAIAYHARLILRGEPLYGTHHPTHHMPAAYYVYAFAFLLFGDSVFAVKLVLLLWTIVSVLLLYWLGTKTVGWPAGALAGAFYALLSSHVYLYGSTAEIELFANLPRIVAVLALVHCVSGRVTAWRYIFVGLASALAFLFKAVYLSSLAIAGVVLLVQLWHNRRVAGAWRRPVLSGLWTVAGFGLGLLPVLLYFAACGLLSRFIQVFALGFGYVDLPEADIVGTRFALVYPILGLAFNNVVLLTLGLAGLLKAVVDVPRSVKSGRGWGGISCVALWLALSIAEASVARVQFLYYYQLVVPPLSLMAGWFLLGAHRQLQGRVPVSRRWVSTAILVVVLLAALAISARQNWNHYASYAEYRLGSGTYQGFLLRGWFERLGPEFVRLQRLADYVRAQTTPDDYVYYWSGNVQFYYLADRRCPIDVIWPLYAEATGSYERIFVPQTKYVIVGDSFYIARPDWLLQELQRDYELETVLEGEEIYRRAD